MDVTRSDNAPTWSPNAGTPGPGWKTSDEDLIALKGFSLGPERLLRDVARVYSGIQTLRGASTRKYYEELPISAVQTWLSNQTRRTWKVGWRPDEVIRDRKAPDVVLTTTGPPLSVAIEVTQWALDPKQLRDLFARLELIGGLSIRLDGRLEGSWHIVVGRRFVLPKREREAILDGVAEELLTCAPNIALLGHAPISEGLQVLRVESQGPPRIAFHFERPVAGPRSVDGERQIDIRGQFRPILSECVEKFAGQATDGRFVVVLFAESMPDPAQVSLATMPLQAEFPMIDGLFLMPSAGDLGLLVPWCRTDLKPR